MIIGYAISAQDDDTCMLGEDTYIPASADGFYTWRFGSNGAPHPATCAKCGRKMDPDYLGASYRVKKRRRDITATYDDYLLVSTRFRNYCLERKYAGVEFAALPNDKDFYWLRPTRLISFDAERRKTRFEKFCDACGHYFDVIGATPIFLKDMEKPLTDGFYRTDIEFGSGHEQGPIVIVGPRTAHELKQQEFSGLELETVKNAF